MTLYHKTTSEAGVETVEEVSQFNLTEFKKEDYLVKVEMEDQPEIFAGITEVIAPQTETGKVSFKLDRKDYTTSQAGQTIEGAVVEFGTKSNDKVSTKYITMQSLIDQMKANPGGTLLSSNRWQLPFRFIFLLKKSFFWLLISSHVKQAFPFSLYLSIQSNHMPYCRILISLSVFLWRLR